MALDIGTNNIAASILKVDLETWWGKASENKVIDMKEHIYALAGFVRTENKNFFGKGLLRKFSLIFTLYGVHWLGKTILKSSVSTWQKLPS